MRANRERGEHGTENASSCSGPNGDQLVFVSRPGEVKVGTVSSRQVIFSRRLRVPGGTWNPLMLVNYAEQVGLKIDGLARFEEWYKASDGRRARRLKLVA